MPRPPAREVEHVVADLAVLARGRTRRRRAGATPSSSATVGATSTRRAARGTSPSARTPFPAITNGARACTTPSEPCSPRWPPWSSQLWAAEWITHRSGAAGWSKSWATCSNANGYEFSPRVRVGAGALGFQPGELVGGLVGERVGTLARDLLVAAAFGPPEADPTVVRTGLVRRRRGEQDHVDDRVERAVEQDVERALRRRRPRSAVISWTGTAVGRSRHARKATRLEPDCLGRRRQRSKPVLSCAYLQPQAQRHRARLARHRRRRRRARPPGDRGRQRCCAASTSRPGRRTSTPATT